MPVSSLCRRVGHQLPVSTEDVDITADVQRTRAIRPARVAENADTKKCQYHFYPDWLATGRSEAKRGTSTSSDEAQKDQVKDLVPRGLAEQNRMSAS